MKEIVTTITKKGQVTIPVEIRHLLGFKAKDKVAFRIDGDNVRLAPAKYNLETAYGVVKPLKRPEDFKKLKQTAIKEHVKKVMEEMKK
ncbi:MAG: AbrB/MazE/SpoVT family DNA-binding domain-containing protein [Actinobacteria bacterium]|nr:AbrB/MazE/SpoVT family DNA-binding domain-containing protein [Actinomycetota bacterium]